MRYLSFAGGSITPSPSMETTHIGQTLAQCWTNADALGQHWTKFGSFFTPSRHSLRAMILNWCFYQCVNLRPCEYVRLFNVFNYISIINLGYTDDKMLTLTFILWMFKPHYFILSMPSVHASWFSVSYYMKKMRDQMVNVSSDSSASLASTLTMCSIRPPTTSASPYLTY